MKTSQQNSALYAVIALSLLAMFTITSSSFAFGGGNGIGQGQGLGQWQYASKFVSSDFTDVELLMPLESIL